LDFSYASIVVESATDIVMLQLPDAKGFIGLHRST